MRDLCPKKPLGCTLAVDIDLREVQMLKLSLAEFVKEFHDAVNAYDADRDTDEPRIVAELKATYALQKTRLFAGKQVPRKFVTAVMGASKDNKPYSDSVLHVLTLVTEAFEAWQELFEKEAA